VQLNLFDPDLTRVEFMEFTLVKEPCWARIHARKEEHWSASIDPK